MIVHFSGFLTLLIYRCVIVAQGSTKILPVFLVTSFSVFNSDSISHPNQFYPIIWDLGNYFVDIPVLLVLGIAFATSLLRVISVFFSNGLISPDGYWPFDKGYIYGFKYQNQLTEEQKKEGVSDVFLIPSIVHYFDDGEYRNMQLDNFYIKQVISGNYWLRWLEWFLDGGALLWAIMTLSPINDTFLLINLVMVFGGVIALAFLHEHINRIKLSNVDLQDPIMYYSWDNINPIVRRRPKKWWAFIIGIVLNFWIWIVIFMYYGYADNLNFPSYQWFRLAIAPIGASFYLVIIPIGITVWSFWHSHIYTDFGLQKASLQNVPKENLNGKPVEAASYGLWSNYALSDRIERSYFYLSPFQQTRIRDYVYYQDWNKNVIYEIVMISIAGICKHSIIWILWIGIITQ
jgi:hypothetical protein